MFRKSPFIVACSPVQRGQPPIGNDWVHEVKFDGWRIQLHKSTVARRSTQLVRASPSGGRIDRSETTALWELTRQIPRRGRCLMSHPLPRH
jgi:hypothetical protein